MTGGDNPVARLLALPAGPGLVQRWAETEGVRGSPYEALFRAFKRHATVNPGQSLAAAQRVLQSSPGPESLEDEGFLRQLEANALFMVGRAADALPAYRAACDKLRRAGNHLEAGRATIGWTAVHVLQGDLAAAQRVARRGRSLLPPAEAVLRAHLDSNLGGAFEHAGRLEAAAGRYRRAHRALLRAGERSMAGACSHNLGFLEMLAGEPRRARKHLDAARREMGAKGPPLHRLYVDTTLADLDLHEGHWDRGLEAIRNLRVRFEELGDARATAQMNRSLARMFTSLGAFDVAEAEAAEARRALARLGIEHELAEVALLEGRLAASMGRTNDALERLDESRRHWKRVGNHRARHRARLETARALLAAAEPERAEKILVSTVRYLKRVDPRGGGALAQGALAECRLAAGRHAAAERLARSAHERARHHPASLERPHLALLVARACAAREDGEDTVRWARRAVQELEALLTRFGERHVRVQVGDSRNPVYQEAIDLVLGHGGPRAEQIAVDLLAKARSPVLIEDLMVGRASRLTAQTRDAIARLRDELLSGPEGSSGDTRHRSLSARVARLERRLTAGPAHLPAMVRAAWKDRGYSSWKSLVKDRDLVMFDRSARSWRAFVVSGEGRGNGVRHVELPDASEALRESWWPLRITLETAAHVPASRRESFLSRTLPESMDCLGELRAAFWDPLDVQRQRVVVIPFGDLHALPLEALAPADHVISRLPHPALLRPERAPRRKAALLLQGSADRAGAEIRGVAAVLRRAGYSVRCGRRRRLLQEEDRPLGVLHVAAHGAFHRQGWLLSGLELGDGWLGFEQLRRPSLRGALIQFTSCESGQARLLPGSDLEGWMTAGLAAGARELVLTLWKIDGKSAARFSRAFYEHWTEGASAAVAAARARESLRAEGRHPFSWAPFVAVT